MHTYKDNKEITDTDLEANKTYYYKVKFANNGSESNIIKAITTSAINDNNNKEETTNKTVETTKYGRTNPNTGAKLPTTIMLLVPISVVFFKNKLSKKSLFK